ncbi:MAG: hypothetical protein ABIS01_12635 [Ferruginibacter sp.]
MRKGIENGMSGTIPFNVNALIGLQNKGYKFVQVKGLTIDKHFDYVEPYYLLLVPLMELPTEAIRKDIYEPIKSELLYKWATEVNEHPQILVANNLYK